MVHSSCESHRDLYGWSSRIKHRRRLFGLLCFFFISLLSLLLFWSLAPVPLHGVKPTKFPFTLDELKVVAEFFKVYKDDHYIYISCLFSVVYLHMQTFAIPGSLFMNLLAGALFGRWLGAFVVCPLTALGASCCYLLSWMYAASFIERYFVATVRKLKTKVEANNHRLLYFLLCARIFPFTPHWLVNIASPFIGVPLHKFFLAVLLGGAPYNFLVVHAGGILADIKKTSDILDWKTITELLLLALFILIVGLMVKKQQVAESDTVEAETDQPLVTDTELISAR